MVLAFAGTLMMAAAGVAQNSPGTPARQESALELAFTYAATISDLVNGSRFWMQAATLRFTGNFIVAGGVADISGAHTANIDSTDVGPDLVTAAFCPRCTWIPAHSRYSLYCQGLADEVWGMNSVFPSSAGTTTTVDMTEIKNECKWWQQ